MKTHKSQSGQVLLLIILLSTALLTVGLSISQISTEEQRVAKLEEQSKVAFSAAEAGLEAAIQGNPGDPPVNLSDLGFDSSISGSASIQEIQAPTFTTPLLGKDEMYSFYLSTYNPLTGQIEGSASSESLKIALENPDPATYCSSDDKKLVVELTLLNKDDNRIATRRLIDECDIIANHPTEGAVDEMDFEGGSNDTLDLSSSPAHILLIRLLATSVDFDGAKFKIINVDSNNWPPQGKTVVSQANTTSEVSKKIRLFQSYPQPATDFFVTSF